LNRAEAMRAILMGVLVAFALIATLADESLAQRGAGKGPQSGRGAGFVTRSMPRSFDNHSTVLNRESGRGRTLHHRGRRGESIFVGAVEGYAGPSDNCVLEQQFVWNGWATMRELVTVCY
jgi:hypothetical protein